ncbi:MAG TPA: PLP-dependent transferase, partial [Blastocatellia bacterium]|nr:PLP-dependent transferase [Blastocatellia bacterium]
GYAAAEALLSRVRLARRAASLGGVETLLVHPAAMWASAMSPEELAAAGVSGGLVRLSVGLEDAGDLIDDLSQALARLNSD